MTIRTRFAPSPTGYLHIGGVRTALFCWLFARHHQGNFVLRIDDTDRERNVDEALAPILEGFQWLGIHWDEGPGVGGPNQPYYQSQRADRYAEAVAELLRRGAAYRDYATAEEIAAQREAAQAEKKSWVYDRQWMAETEEQAARFEAEGRQAVVRLKMPREGVLKLQDLIRGEVEFEWAREQDHVIQRADGSCLYHLATVVDDNDFQITHVIRAEEHLSNTPRQVFIAQSLGYALPQFAHVPFVAEPGSKTKLSKRKLDKYLKNRDFNKLYEQGRAIADRLGLEIADDTFNPVIVDFYEQIGFLPEAILNYLCLLGWSFDDSREMFTLDELIENFTLEGVNKAAASFDPAKLLHFQSHYMQQLPLKQKVAWLVPFLQKAGLVSSPPACDLAPKLGAIVTAADDRIVIAGDILQFDDFFVDDDALQYEEKAFAKRIVKPEQATSLLAKFRQQLEVVEPFDAENLDKLLHDFVETESIKIGEIIHAIRVAVTGKAVGFGVFETLAILGRASSLRRIDNALEKAQAASTT